MSRPAERVVAWEKSTGRASNRSRRAKARSVEHELSLRTARRQRGAAPASCARLQPRQFPAHTGDTEAGPICGRVSKFGARLRTCYRHSKKQRRLEMDSHTLGQEHDHHPAKEQVRDLWMHMKLRRRTSGSFSGLQEPNSTNGSKMINQALERDAAKTRYAQFCVQLTTRA